MAGKALIPQSTTASRPTPVMTCPPIPTYSPAVTRRVVESAFDSWRATVDGTMSYWRTAWERGLTPLDFAADVSRWASETASRREPEWASPNEVLLETPLVRLRDFSAGSEDPVVPTLLVPPQAGHSSCIVDYSPEQSQVKTAIAGDLTRLYSLDWVGATPATRDAGIEDYLAFMREAIELIGGPVNLIGDCQGGWLSAIYAALHPDDVHTLTIAGAPIDFHAGGAAIHDYVQLLEHGFYEDVVRLGGGTLRGEFMLNGFIALKPESELAKHVELFANIHDADHVERHRAFEDWFKHTQDIPGAFYLWIVEHLFRDNALIKGELSAGGEIVDLSRISCPLNLLAGKTDHITPPAQVFALADAVSTPRDQIVERVTSGGHLGLFMGREALRDHWPVIIERIQADSRPEHRAHARAATPPVRTPVPAP